MRNLTHAQAARQMSHIARSAAGWAGDVLTLDEQASQPWPAEHARRFTAEIEGKLSIFGEGRRSRSEILQDRIKELVEDGDGFWRACSGCQEGDDGHVSETDYPFDSTFQCQPGGGCSECGGLGVIWDNADYDQMADAMLADMEAESNYAPPAADEDRVWETPGADEAFDAIDVADRLIERAYGDEVPTEWTKTIKGVAKARSALKSTAAKEGEKS